MLWKPRKPAASSRKGAAKNIIVELLNSRGIVDTEGFLNPPESVLHSPYLLRNIEEVCYKIIEAVKQNKRICISADCDSDGVFSTAAMVRYISQFTDNYYVSFNQRSEGHGVENQLHMITDDTDLIIILDSSTNSSDACKSLQDRMIDVVILDHHDYENENPHAVIVNPKLDDTYPNKHISGAGVVYKVLQVLDDTFGTGAVDDLIDLVACGMYADMMPVNVLENRRIIIQGMKNINNIGLLAILDATATDLEAVNSQTIGFTISPLINGCARLDKIELGIELLLCDDYDRCAELVKTMRALNDERKVTEKMLFEKYSSTVNHEDKILVAIDEHASKGFNGLIANKIAQEFHKPAIVMREHEGSLAGSFRTYGDFQMKTFLNQKVVKKYIKYAVGHEFAGGIGMRAANFKKFMDFMNEKLKDYQFEVSIEYDMELDADSVSVKLLSQIEEFDYLTGTEFPPALFLIRNLFVEGDRKVMGKNKDTVKIPCDGVDVIKFKVNEKWAEDVGQMDYIDVVGQLKLNEWKKWNGQVVVTSQIVAEDYKNG
ncbi:DHH family phosphoesterase [Paenibacillus sp. FSL R7-0302]|uniref:DHH family phosphoesterase n=1 Tax=Paenibacillus sp. FSL R7-0302 TaxID=2921681 RepID=UPI0030F9AC1A